MRLGPPILAVLLSGCRSSDLPDEVDLAVRLRGTSVGGRPVTWKVGTFAVRVVRLRPCPSQPVVLSIPGDVPEAVRTIPSVPHPQPWSDGFSDPIPVVPPDRAAVHIGPWCALDLVVDGPLAVVGQVQDGGTIALDVDLPSLGVTSAVSFAGPEVVGFTVDGVEGSRIAALPLVAELGALDWLDGVPVPGPGEEVDVGPGDPTYEAIRTGLLAGAMLYRDPDDDGLVDPEERTADLIGPLLPLD